MALPPKRHPKGRHPALLVLVAGLAVVMSACGVLGKPEKEGVKLTMPGGPPIVTLAGFVKRTDTMRRSLR